MKHKAFTLAETLITIGIIGVVAAMTIPTLIKNYKAQVTATKLKKTYSILSQAMNAAVAKYGDSKYWPEWDTSAEDILRIYLAPEIINAKVYPTNNDWGKTMCFEKNALLETNYGESKVQYSWMDGTHISTPFQANITASIKLNDNTCIGLNPAFAWGTPKMFMIDINGSNIKPNRTGYDLFFFTTVDNNIYPYKYDKPYEELMDANIRNSCHPKAPLGGSWCAAKIMQDNWEIKYW